MTKRRANVHEPDTPLGRWIWTEKQTGEEFTTETTRQRDSSFLCAVVEHPEIRATGDTPEEATRIVLDQMERRMNPNLQKDEEQAFERAFKKVFTVHADLFRRLAEYDRQQDGRRK